jgi:hypothetical protein
MAFSAQLGRWPLSAGPAALTLLPFVGALLAGCVEPGVGEPLKVSQSSPLSSAPSEYAGMKLIQPAFETRTVQAITEKAMTQKARTKVASLDFPTETPGTPTIDETDLIQSPSMPDLTMADRVVALQTQTMLAGLACGRIWADAGAFQRYADFTIRNSSLLRRSQSDVAARLGGAEAFDRMHTRISNGESKRLIDLGDASYCAEMRKPFYIVVALDEQRLAELAMDHETVFASLQ